MAVFYALEVVKLWVNLRCDLWPFDFSLVFQYVLIFLICYVLYIKYYTSETITIFRDSNLNYL